MPNRQEPIGGNVEGPFAAGASLPIAQTDVTGLTAALAAKLSAANPTFSGNLQDGAGSISYLRQISASFPNGLWLDAMLRLTAEEHSASEEVFAAGSVVLLTGAGLTITLPAAPVAGSYFIFKDVTGAAAGTPHTIARNGKNIDGAAANKTLNTNYGTIKLYYDGTQWLTL